MSFFNQVDSTLKKADSKLKVENPLLYTNSDSPMLTLLIDECIGKELIHKLNVTIKNRLGDISYQILYCAKFKINNKTIEREIVETYYNNRVDLKKYIPYNSKIVAIGRSIYSLTGNKDIDTKSFYDYITNDTYFYAPDLKSYVFPVGMFFKWIEKDNFDRWFAFEQIKKAHNFEIALSREKPLQKILLEKPNEFFSERLDSSEDIALDTETSGLDFTRDRIGCITFSFDGLTGYYARWSDIDKELFNSFLKNKFQVYANGKFDVKFFWKEGIINAQVDFDTLNAGHCLSEMRSNSLKTHAWMYSQFGGYERPLDDYMKKYKKTENYLEIPESILFEYATMDAIITFQVYQKMKNQLSNISERIYPNTGWNLERYYYEIVIPSVRTFSEIEYNGLYIDWNRVDEVTEEIKKDLYDEQEKVLQLIGKKRGEINLDSAPQLGKALEAIGLPNPGLSKDGNYLTNEDSVIFWKNNGHPEAECVNTMKGISTILETFVGEPFKKYCGADNKVHPSFHVMLARSGRNRSSEPNFQNIPKTGKYAKLIRSFYTPPSDEYYLCEYDAAGFQLRIGALMSDDPTMRKVFTELGGDMHSMTAQSLWYKEMPLEEFIEKKGEMPYKEYRKKAKYCFVAGTEILTNKGFYPVENLIPEINPNKHTIFDKKLKAITRKGSEIIESTFFGYENIFTRISLVNGDVIEVTSYHNMMVERNGIEISVEAQDVLTTDFILKIEEGLIEKIEILSVETLNLGRKKIYSLSVTPSHEVIIRINSKSKNNYLSFQCNFSLEFGAGAYVFTKTGIAEEWSIEETDDYIKKFNLFSQIEKNKEALMKFHESTEDINKFAKWYTVGKHIREGFFKTYPILEQWIFKTNNQAVDDGYVVAPHGAIRRLPQLTHQGVDVDGGEDKNLRNISVNSPVQNFEASLMNMTINYMHSYIKTNGLKSQIIGAVHDAMILYVHKDELEIITKQIKGFFEEDRPINNKIPFEIKGEKADYTAGEVWAFGSEF